MIKEISSIVLSALLSACTPCNYELLSKMPLDSSVPQEYREKVSFIKEVRKFGVEQLGLHRCTQHYTTFSKTDQEAHMLYRLFIVKPNVLPSTLNELSEDFANPTSYRKNVEATYFTSFTDTLEDEAAYYKSKGYDTFFRNVTHYNKPDLNRGSVITPSFLKNSKTWQTQTVLHEICHDSIAEWISQDFSSELDEPFCDMMGRVGSIEYFKFKTGTDSEDYKQALDNYNYQLNYSQKINQFYIQLQNLYRSNIPLSQKLQEREKIFTEIKNSLNVDANNAALWDNHAYTQHYPLMLQLYNAQNNNIRKTLGIMKNCPKQKDKALRYVQESIKKNN